MRLSRRLHLGELHSLLHAAWVVEVDGLQRGRAHFRSKNGRVEGRWYKMAFQRGVGVGQRGEEGLFSARIDKFEIDRS